MEVRRLLTVAQRQAIHDVGLVHEHEAVILRARLRLHRNLNLA
ncbi:hypothetical protein [Streptomyces sp. NPDC049915]